MLHKIPRTLSFYVAVLQRAAKKSTRINNARAQQWHYSLNLLFGDALVAVAVPVCLKPRPNDSNNSTQHIATLLAQRLQAPAKRSQHLNATDRNIVGRNMLRAFGHPVATCWTCCPLKIELVRMRRRNIVARIWPSDYNIMQHPQMLREKFDHFQKLQTTPNMSQHIATRHNMVAKRAQHVALNNVAICCDRLAGA